MRGMNKPSWPKVFAFVGLAIIGLAFAWYAATVGTAGIAASVLGKKQDGLDLLSLGSAVILIGIGAMAAFGYLAARGVRDLTRR
jgi:threonine/homoserine/homoserine lactone efflux protein